MHCTALNAPFGARLHLDRDAPLTGEERRALRGFFREHGLLVVRGREISREQQIDLLASLGRLEPDAHGEPMEMEVTNQHELSTAPEGELVFHSDYAYDPAPTTVISMYGLVIEGDVTPTLFASSTTVLDRLPKELVERLRRHEASHGCFLHRWNAPGERAQEPDPLIPRGEPGWGPDHYWTRHPVVWENPSGVETLFVCLQHTDCILDLPREESDVILQELYAALYEPSQIYTHEWQPHDLVIWDNITVQHARPEPRPGPRTLRRFHVSPTDLTGDYVRVARELGIM